MEEFKPKRRNTAPRQTNSAEPTTRRRAPHPRAAVQPAAEGAAAKKTSLIPTLILVAVLVEL